MNTEPQENPIMMFRLVTNELVVGVLNKDHFKTFGGDILYIENPAVVASSNGKIFLTKWNMFSALGLVMVSAKTVIYVDSPNKMIVDSYKELTQPKPEKQTTTDETGETHTLH